MKKKIVLPALAIGVLALAGSIWFGSVNANAASANHDTLIEKIAQKFSVPKEDVQVVFDQERTERQATRRAEQNTKLDQAIADGVITAEQKDQLIAKRNELNTQGQKNREEMQKWFSDNGIDHDKLAPYMGMGGNGGRGGHMGGMHRNQK
ncbi:MAG: hypothetical protein WC107_00940 [Patescibacteria group bacterium]